MKTTVLFLFLSFSALLSAQQVVHITVMPVTQNKRAEFLTLCLDNKHTVSYTGDATYSDIKKVIPAK